jgi:hypothetical protein
MVPLTAAGQTVFGVKAGVNISDIVMTNYVNPDVEADLGLKIGPHAGFFVNGTLENRFGLAAELLYSNKGVKGNTDIHLHYITLPVFLQYGLNEHFTAELGPEAAYLFSAKSAYGDVSSTYNNRFDLSLDAGLRYDTPRLTFGVRYAAGLFSVRDAVDIQGLSGGRRVKYQNRVLQFSVGYKLRVLE